MAFVIAARDLESCVRGLDAKHRWKMRSCILWSISVFLVLCTLPECSNLPPLQVSNSTLFRTFHQDVSKLSSMRAKELPQLHYMTTSGSTYRVLWDTAAWDEHASNWRYWRHLASWWQSTTSRRVVPIVASLTAWAGVVCAASRWKFELSMPMAPLTLVSSALAMLLTLRTNQSLTRLMEARAAWGRLVLHARIVAGILWTRVAPINPRAAVLGGRLLCSIGWLLRGSMLGLGVDAEALEALLPPAEAEWISAQRKPALAALDRLQTMLREMAADPNYSDLPLAWEPHRIMLQGFVDIDGVIGVCERILSSPVPPSYTRFTSRILLTWLASLPLALRGAGLSALMVVLGTAFTSFVMMGIDEMAIEMEEPMRLMPLNQICNAAMRDVVGRIAPATPAPPLPIHGD